MKNKRHETIVRLVNENDIGTQELLCERLAEEGFDVTQATVSRDIKQLALIKTALPGGGFKYVVPTLKRAAGNDRQGLALSILSDSVVEVDHAMNTVVVKCRAGMAQAVCANLDSTELYNVVGTLAGEDTIFILMRTEKDAERLVKELHLIISE